MASCAPSLFDAQSLVLGAAGSGLKSLSRRDAVLAPEHLRLPGPGLWVWDGHGRAVDRKGSWMSWRGSDAGVLPWGLEGLLGGNTGIQEL